MDNFAAIFLAMREKLQVSLSAHSVAGYQGRKSAPGAPCFSTQVF